jgi:ABC-type antimicrobial peptide transport system permease subunit
VRPASSQSIALPRRRIPRPEAWRIASVTAIAVGVGFSVLLMSASYGVSSKIQERLSAVTQVTNRTVDVSTITSILTVMTVVVTTAMLVQTAVVTFIVGVTVMRSRREEIAIRRQSGVLRSQLLKEFLLAMLASCLVGGVVGEFFGLLAASILAALTPLPVRFTAVSVLAAFPVTVALALLATLLPAWSAANASPALARKE